MLRIFDTAALVAAVNEARDQQKETLRRMKALETQQRELLELLLAIGELVKQQSQR